MGWDDHDPAYPTERPLVSPDLLTCAVPLALLLSALAWVPILLLIGAIAAYLRTL